MIKYLRHNDGESIPERWLFIGTETIPVGPEGNNKVKEKWFRLGMARYVRFSKGKIADDAWHRINEPAELWQLVEKLQKPDRSLWVCSHQLYHDLTATHFWELLEKGKYHVYLDKANAVASGGRKKREFKGYMVLSHRPTFLYLCGVKGRVHFVDSNNYAAVSTATIADSMSLRKPTLPDWKDSDEVWFDWCEHSVRSASEFMAGVLKQWYADGIGTWKPTAAMLSMTSFRHHCKVNEGREDCPRVVVDDDAEKIALQRIGYMGGRVACYFVGKTSKILHCVDVNGLYPYVMRQYEYPYRLAYYTDNSTVEQVRGFINTHGVMAAVRICSGLREYPCKSRERQVHATGTFWTVLCGEELRRAIVSGDVDKTGWVMVFNLASIFRRWVDYWWKRKTDAKYNGDIAGSIYAKTILNSLSGKWAQRGGRWNDRPNLFPARHWGEWTMYDESSDTSHRLRAIAGKVQEYVEGNPPEHCFPAISAFITANGREYMRGIRGELPVRSVYHQATDSLIIDDAALSELENSGMICQDTLGRLKREQSGEGGEFLGINHYRIGSEWTMQGLYGIGTYVDGVGIVADTQERLPTMVRSGPGKGPRVFRTTIESKKVMPNGRVNASGFVSPPELFLPSDKDYLRYCEQGYADLDTQEAF